MTNVSSKYFLPTVYQFFRIFQEFSLYYDNVLTLSFATNYEYEKEKIIEKIDLRVFRNRNKGEFKKNRNKEKKLYTGDRKSVV